MPDDSRDTTIWDTIELVSSFEATTTDAPFIMGAYGLLFILLVIAAIVLICTLLMMLLTYLGCSTACQRCRYLNRELMP
ncbi:uncharacterized protein Dana_GF13277 [Drosophila ananassae]|uniref:Uncharacterized protein n=1 Tax=Drosophila ananassae TaxID=7217 RepID=A0A0N8P0A7_DROAN|nr:uncharacterized protein Dana_GF13277 [Drosophila ananassae]